MYEQLLPVEAAVQMTSLTHHWDYIYEPDAKEVLDGLLVRYIESQVYQGVVENKACEQAARMVAMKSATDNAGDLIDELQLVYNKARQAAITQELSEIVSWRRSGIKSNDTGLIAQRLVERGSGDELVERSYKLSARSIDVEFPRDQVPNVYDALVVEKQGLTLEVQQQLGDGVVRAIAMGVSDGLSRGLSVSNKH